MRRLFCFTFLFTILALSLVSFAQEEEQSDQVIEYEISVTADRLEEPVKDKTDSVTIITREEIEQQQWRYVSDALREVPGLSVLRSGSPGKTTSLFLRGGNPAQVLVLIDGMRINDPFFGGVDIADITTDNVERIEIVRGPQSPLFGSDAMAGVINIITRKGETGTQVNASFEGGSFETFREKAGLSGSSGKASYTLSYSRQDSEGQFDNDEFKQNNFSASTSYAFNNTTDLSATARVHDSHTGIPFGLADTPSPLRFQDTQLTVLGTSLRHSDGDYVNLKTGFSFSHTDFHFEDPDDIFFGLSVHRSATFQAGLQNDFQITEFNTLTVGYEFEQQGIDASDNNGDIPALDDFDTTIHALYAQNKWESDRWIVTAGLRFDHHNTFGDTVNPRIAIAYRPQSDWKIRGSFGTAFRAPSAGDLVFPFFGNPNLEPEKSDSWELGVEHFWNETAVLSVAFFRNDYEDLISFDENFVAANIALALAQGLELSGSVRHHNWNFTASYTFLDTEDEIENHQLFRRPRHSGSVRVGYDTGKWGASVQLLGVGERLEQDFSTFPAQNVFNPGYAKVDLAGNYRMNSWMKLHGRIENLFDKEYEEVLTFHALGIGAYGGIEFGF